MKKFHQYKNRNQFCIQDMQVQADHQVIFPDQTEKKEELSKR